MPSRPAYRAICSRASWIMSSTCDVRASDSAALPPGYQCRSTKSMSAPAMLSTVRFQVPWSPAPTRPSGQLPGVVSTAPTSIDGSTAFIARAKATTPRAYAVALLSGWSSASQAEP